MLRETQKERMKMTKQTIQEPWENDKRCHMCLTEIPAGEERKEQRTILSNNYLEFFKINDPQTHRLRKLRISNMINTKTNKQTKTNLCLGIHI